jgi:exonuclease III
LDIKKSLRTALCSGTSRKYKLWENSNKSNRGVALLIATDLDCEIFYAMEDEEQNILMLKIKIQKNILILGAVYGPNGNCVRFYETLDFFFCDQCGTRIATVLFWGETGIPCWIRIRIQSLT